MSRFRRVLLVAFCGALTVASLIYVRLALPYPFRRSPATVATGSAAPSGTIRFAVLGDSDSQSFHDNLTLADPSLRGGPHRATTWQWTEVLGSSSQARICQRQ